MNKQELQIFLEKLASGEYSNEEYAAFVAWVENSSREDYQQMLDYWEELVDSREMFEGVSPQLIESIERGLDNIDQRKVKIRPLWPRIAAAASILLMLSFGGYFILHKKQPTQQITLLKPGTFKNDVLPGKNKAYITLANGKQIAVSTTANGNIAQQGNTNIQKNANGEVVYQPSATTATEIAYNTFTTPRGGGKQRLVLADGTIAVLDAGSSLRYPVAFIGKDRKVSMTGRVYFEVTHQDAHPFFLTAKNQTIEDLGTHFNVDAFDDEPEAKTTLLEGSLKVNGKTLKPGQQAVITKNGQTTVNINFDEEEVMAWKNDLFKFTNNTSLTAVMRQLSRWYDLDVVYQGKGKDYHFGGFVPRNSKLSEVLRILELSGVQFAVDGKKIIVYQ